MLVRLRKRGNFVNHSVGGWAPLREGAERPSASLWRGAVIEVEPVPNISYRPDCAVFQITDERLASRSAGPAYTCHHNFIDDLDAYESDSADEQAEIGDLAAIQLPQTQKVRA